MYYNIAHIHIQKFYKPFAALNNIKRVLKFNTKILK